MPTQNDLSLAVALANSMSTPVADATRRRTEAEQNSLSLVVSQGSTPTRQATPTFNPVAGPYVGTQNVTITSASATAILYTTDGTTPNAVWNVAGGAFVGLGTSTLYSGAVAVAASGTLKALAIKTGKFDSVVGSAAYVIS